VVHTLGTLLENSSYKQAIRQSDAASLVGMFAKHLKGDNPLAKGSEGSYERINKDSGVCASFQLHRRISENDNIAYRISHITYCILHIAYRPHPALTVLQTYLCEAKDLSADKTFVYISAEDIFRPVIPARYIKTKREAEKEIASLCEASGHNVRPIFIRPSTWFSVVLPIWGS